MGTAEREIHEVSPAFSRTTCSARDVTENATLSSRDDPISG